ncbi:MAG: response regulator, partial [Elusimicrobiota bacterium]
MPITEKPKLLVVDDDPDFLELCWICLSKDFRVELAGNADEAVEKLGKSRPSAVLLDLRMPGVSGVEVLKYMQMWPLMRRIPVIVITASELNDRLERMLRAHGNVYNCFEKTVSLDA